MATKPPRLTWPQPDGTYCKVGDFSVATPAQLYAAWLDPAIVGKAIGSTAKIEPEVGGRYVLGRKLAGTIVELVPNHRIVLALAGTKITGSHAFLEIQPYDDDEAASQLDVAHIGLPDKKTALAMIALWKDWVAKVCKAAATDRPGSARSTAASTPRRRRR